MRATPEEMRALATLTTAGRNPARNANPRNSEGLNQRGTVYPRGNDRPRPGGSGPAARRFWNAVDVYIRAGKTVQQAVRETAVNDPQLHAAFVAEANAYFRAKEGAR